LLVLDLMLPKMSGYELAVLLRTQGLSQHMPIILITALVHKNEEEMVNSQVVDFYLKKPFELDQLVNKIKELLKVEYS
jgi:DNA-binding response OmpR family regulator